MEYKCPQVPREAGVPRQIYMHIDSDQRDKSYVSSDPTNPTNDIVIPLNSTNGRTEVSSITLSMWELPSAVHTVIDLKSSYFYFSQGFIIDHVSDTLEVRRGNVIAYATLPLTSNPIIDVNGNVVTTMYPHNFPLGKKSLVNLVGSLLEENQMPVDAYALSTTVLQLSTDKLAQTAPFGYVTVPRIPTPMILARLLGEQLINAIGVDVRYDACTGQFSLFVQSQKACSGAFVKSLGVNDCFNGCDALLKSVDENTSSSNVATLVMAPYDGLPGVMGFGYGCSIQIAEETSLVGKYGIGCYGTIRMPSLQYQPSQIGTTLETEWNRFYFDGRCGTATPESFTFSSDTSNGCQSFTIPFGKYSPYSLGGYMKKQMNLLDPTHSDYEVEFIANRYCISSMTKFSLEFYTNDVLATRLGFDNNPHRGSNEYCSDTEVFAPLFKCCYTPESRSPSSILYTEYITGTQRLRFRLSAPDGSTVTISSVNNSTGDVVITSNTAIGVQSMDHVRIAGRTLMVNQSPFNDAFSATLQWPTPLPVVGDTYRLEHANAPPAPLGLLFAPRPELNQVKGWPFGFPSNCDVFSLTPTSNMTSESSILTTQLTYLLLALDEPSGTGAGYHSYENDHLDNILAKLQLYSYIRLDRTPTFTIHFPQPVVITRLKFRLLTPEHTLYPLKGLKWSATLLMTLTERRLPTLGCTSWN